MKKILITIAVLLMTLLAFAGNNQLLWKVSGNGLERPSYILGSHHVAPASMINEIPGLENAVAASDEIWGEVRKDQLDPSAMQAKMMQMAIAPADSAISRLLTPSQYHLVDSILTAYMGVPGLIKQMDMLKPAMITTTISAMQIAKACPDFDTDTPFDVRVMSIGDSLGKSVNGFETAEFQLELLLNAPLTKQIEDLMKACEDESGQIALARKLSDAYSAQDLDAVARGVFEEDETDEIELETMIYSRNRSWAKVMAERMPQASMFVVVGCGHLPGDQGLINLLRKQGYTVTNIENQQQ